MNGATEPGERTPALERARQLVLAYGWNSTSYQILAPGIERWAGVARQRLEAMEHMN